MASEGFRLLTKQVESADSHLGLLLDASEQDIRWRWTSWPQGHDRSAEKAWVPSSSFRLMSGFFSVSVIPISGSFFFLVCVFLLFSFFHLFSG